MDLISRRGLLVASASALAGVAVTKRLNAQQLVWPSITEGFNRYNNNCICNTSAGQNCAHFMSDALIRAGYLQLLSGFTTWGCAAAWGSKRPVQAKEMCAWFKGRALVTLKGGAYFRPAPGTGIYVVYQQYTTSPTSQGHVCFWDSNNGTARGTLWLPWWAVQEFYKW